MRDLVAQRLRAAVWVAISALLLGGEQIHAQDFSGVPGSVVNYMEAPQRFFGQPISPEYISTPSITEMPDGSYIASHDIFGWGSGEDTTKIFRSTDKGRSWTNEATIDDAFWSTVFEHRGDLYLWGYRESRNNGDILIRRSKDNGESWTTPTNNSTGLLRNTNAGGTANVPAIHDGRIWIAQGGQRAMSAPVDSNLLQASSWTLTNWADTSGGPLGSDLTVTEGQVVASPDQGVTVLPKVGNKPYTVLNRVRSLSNIRDPRNGDWVAFPGGGKKFGVQYDATSDRYYALTNPVIHAHRGETSNALTRTTGALLSSKNLMNWDVQKLFLFTPNIDNGDFGEGFQYFNFIIDDVDSDTEARVDDDLAIVSRTALAIPNERRPPRGHDSNLMTFHRIEDFREAEPNHYITIESGKVMRFERTQYRDAPLGRFTLGRDFAGAPLRNPDRLANDGVGNVYIRESTGRVLKFDLAGNFLTTVDALPAALDWSRRSVDIASPTRKNRSWQVDRDGAWSDPRHWVYWGRPDTTREIATFGSANSTTRHVNIAKDEVFTVRGLRFRSENRYIIDGQGALQLQAHHGQTRFDVETGSHTIDVDVALRDNAHLTVPRDEDVLIFYKTLGLYGRTLHKTGAGDIALAGSLIMGGGDLVTDGLGEIAFKPDIADSIDLAGQFVFEPADQLSLKIGTRFDLTDGTEYLANERFHKLILPELGPGKSWNTQSFYKDGSVTVVPEPNTAAMTLVLTLTLIHPRRLARRRQA
jgi:hypothetical protein